MFCLLCDTVYAQMTVIRPADMDALQNALDNNNVSVIITISFIPSFDEFIIADIYYGHSGISFLHRDSYKSISQMH